MEPRRIDTAEELEALRAEYEIVSDWHEPDERDISAIVHGTVLDTAGQWPRATEQERQERITELYVTLLHEGQPIAYLNIALLLNWACAHGYMLTATAQKAT